MDTGARDSLADVISKSLVKLATQPEGKVILKWTTSAQNPYLQLFPSTLVLISPIKFLPFQEVALDDTLLAWPGTFEQWMRGLEYSSIGQLLDLSEYSPYIQRVSELFQYLSHFLQTKLCNPPSSMCCRLLCVHPLSMPPVKMGFKASIFIHWCRRSRPRFVSIILLLPLFHTQSLPAKYICIHRILSYFSPVRVHIFINLNVLKSSPLPFDQCCRS